MKIKKNDKVQIITGKDKGKKGKVIDILAERNAVVVEGINLIVKHVRPRREGEKGQRIQFPSPLNSSKVVLICPKCSKKSKVNYKILENKKKVRVCKKCKEVID